VTRGIGDTEARPALVCTRGTEFGVPAEGRRPALACTGNGSAGRRPSLGTGVPAEGRHWPALGTGVPAEGRHWARECRPKAGTGLHWARECRPKAGTGLHWARECLGRHWPALGARRSAVLPAEGRRWLGRRPGTAARAVCARRSEQCAMYGARLNSMRTLYILLYICTANIKYTYTAVYI